MRIMLLVLVLAVGCSKKKEQAPAEPPKPSPKASAEEAKPPPTEPAADEKPTPTEPDKPEPTTKADANAPTKEMAIERMRGFLAALEAKDNKKAISFLTPIKDPKEAKRIEEDIGEVLKQKEISAAGIDVVAAKGTWGKLAEVLGEEQAARYAGRANVPVEECWGFKIEDAKANASVGFHWDGKELRFIRINNVGKL